MEMTGESLTKKTIKGVIWSVLERFSVQGIHFIVTLVVARLLTPRDFGVVGMMAIFLAVAQSFIDSGFSQALIRKNNRTDVDCSTVFYFNIIVSAILYLLLFFLAPWIAEFYEEPQLVSITRVLCIVVVINSFSVVQRAILTSSLDFKTQTKASLTSSLLSGVAGVIMAIKGFGVWTLVWQQLLDAGICTMLLWFLSKWRPVLIFSWKSFKDLFSFGSKLLASGLIDTIYTNIYPLIVGKVFNASSLGFYTQADKFVKLPSSNLTTVLVRVTYPVLCGIQDDDNRLEINYRRLLRVSAFIIFPLMCVLAGIAKPLINVLLGKEWAFSATLLVPLSFAMMWWPIHAINLNLLKVKGRSDLFLKLEIIKKIIGVSILLASIPFGLVFMCYSSVISSLICLFINTHYTSKFLNISIISQMSDLLGSFVISMLTFTLVFLITQIVESEIIALIVGTLIGFLFYIGLAYLFGCKEIDMVKELIKSIKYE